MSIPLHSMDMEFFSISQQCEEETRYYGISTLIICQIGAASIDSPGSCTIWSHVDPGRLRWVVHFRRWQYNRQRVPFDEVTYRRWSHISLSAVFPNVLAISQCQVRC